MDFPFLGGPGMAADFSVPGYPGSQDETTFTGTAIRIKNSYGIKMSIQHMLAWGEFIRFEASDSGFCGNHEVNFGVMDMSLRAIRFYVHDIGSIDDIRIVGNTTGGRCLVLYDEAGGFISGTNIDINTSFCNSPGDPANASAALGDEEGIYAFGTNIYSNRIKLGRHYAGYSADGPAGVPNTFKGIYIGGNQASLGEYGWFGGDNNIFEIGNTTRYPDTSVPVGGGPPIAGDPIRVKMKGVQNKFIIHPDFFSGAIRTLSSTQGETHYNSGVGSAEISKFTTVKMVLTALGSWATQNFYMYHQGITPSLVRPIKILGVNGGDLAIAALDNSNYVNREIIFTITNTSASPVTADVYAYIEVE
jgi:hypothetical protein